MKKQKWTVGLVAVAAVASYVINGHAQSVDSLLNKLVDKGVLSSQEAGELRAESAKETKSSVLSQLGLPAWDSSLKLGGDFRLRLDDLMPESSLHKGDRLRFRYRLRVGAVWTATDWVTIGARIGSGDFRTALGDGNPNSNNQTMTHYGSKKDLFLDAAYVTLQPPGQDWISVTGGKMNNPLWGPSLNSPMVYDPDLTPEGVVGQLKFKLDSDGDVRAFGNAAAFAMDELSGSVRDIYSFDGQAGLTANLIGETKSPTLKATVAGGWFFTQNLPNTPVGDTSGNAGNAFSAATTYLGDFSTIYARAEATWKISDEAFLGTPCVLTLGGEYDKNLDNTYKNFTPDRDQTEAWTVQATFGQAAKRGQWQVAYQYKYAEADSLFDSLTDDDFGGTDRKGHIVKAAYNVRDYWQIGATAFITEKISNRPNATTHTQQGIPGENQVRVFLDTMFKF